MNVKRLIAVLLALCLALSLCACGGKQEDNNVPEETQNVPAEPVVNTSDVPQQDEAPQEETKPSGITYTVKVQDEGGNPIAGAMVQICQGELCLMPTATDDTGVAVFSVAEEAEYEAKFLSLPAGYDYTTEEQVFHFGSSFELTITLKAVA